MLREDQIDLRRQRARDAGLIIEKLGKNRVFTEYRVTNPATGGGYVVAVRGFATGESTCTCPDYKSNTLGTCKHVEAVLEQLREQNPQQIQKKKATITQPELTLDYGEVLRLQLVLPPRRSDKLQAFAQRFFDSKLTWNSREPFEELIPAVQAVPEPIYVHPEAMEFVDAAVDRHELRNQERRWFEQLDAGTLELPHLRVTPYEYQWRGAIFLAGRGRSILGDDMGLGKTLQTIAAVELLVPFRNLSRVLVVAPASVKYQWAAEIARFAPRATQVIEGDADDRQRQYAQPTFYRLVNYEQVIRDLDALNAWKPECIVLDEAQRIRNWESKTSRAVKKLRSRYAFVLSGTPIENRLEELYSIVQFVDERRFGPAYQFLHDHRQIDEDGNLRGYRHLDRIREKLEPIFLRRTRAEVLTQLPERTETTVVVPLSEPQRGPYEEQKAALARLLRKGFVTQVDRTRILACLSNMRLVCNSTFLLDKSTRHSPKLDEFVELIPEILLDPAHKVVVFSQWELMLHEAERVLAPFGHGRVMLHGSLSSKERQSVLERFTTDPQCRILLSTDAGGVGLNLQVADTVVNLEQPWNPAVLSQRIARVHRLGQKRPVHVIHFMTQGTIEERVARTVQQKQSLFAGVFDGDEEEIDFAAVGQPSVLGIIREALEDAPATAAETVAEKTVAPLPTGPFWAGTLAMLRGLEPLLPTADVGTQEELRQALGKLLRTLPPS
ncbi:MAG: DEAD/DEAH box helicase [Gemmataceae bacterium]